MQEVAAGGRAFLILASDGLWDVVAEQRAAVLTSKAAEEKPGVCWFDQPKAAALCATACGAGCVLWGYVPPFCCFSPCASRP